MRGHLVKRGKNRYSIVLEMYEDGVRRQKWIAFRGNKKEAEARRIELLHQANTGTLFLPGKITVGQYLEQWLADCCQPNRGKRTYEGYCDIVRNRLVPAFGQVKLTDLKAEHIEHFYAELQRSGRLDGKGGLSHQSVRDYHHCLHAALEKAVEWNLLYRNPARMPKKPSNAEVGEAVPLDGEGVAKVLKAFQGTPYYTLVYLAIATGMRRSELLGLKWSDVDLDKRRVRVQRSLHQIRDRSIDMRPTKSKKGKRPMTLPTSVAEVLRDHREKQKSCRAEAGKPLEADDFVFCDPDGSPFLPGRVTQAWIRMRRRIGIKNRFHDLRHTQASVLMQLGIHPKVVQERMGHTRIGVTMDTYTHMMPGLDEAAAEAFDQWLAPRQPQHENGGISAIR